MKGISRTPSGEFLVVEMYSVPGRRVASPHGKGSMFTIVRQDAAYFSVSLLESMCGVTSPPLKAITDTLGIYRPPILKRRASAHNRSCRLLVSERSPRHAFASR